MTKRVFKLSLGAIKRLFTKGRVDLGDEIALTLKTDKEGKVDLEPIEDMVWDLQNKARGLLDIGGKSQSSWPGYSSYKSEPKWGDHKDGKDVIYEGSPFQQTEPYDALPRISALEFPDKVCDKSGLVLIKYSAKWCESCKDFIAVTNKVNMEIKNAFYLMDVSDVDNKVFAKKQGMDVIPTVILYENGKEIDRVEGDDEEKLKKMVEERLKNPQAAEPSDFEGLGWA